MCRSANVFFFQAEDGIRDVAVTGVQTCALPIYESALWRLKSLQIISEEERESLAQKQTSASAFRKVLGERFSRHRERFRKRESAFQHKLLSMALEAFRLGEITRSKLKEIAGSADVSKAELHTLLDGIDVESASRAEEVRIPS